MFNFSREYLILKLLSLPAILLALTVHEWAHAFAAYKLGDNTAKLSGRLSLNPMKHIDIMGFLMLIFAGFGWAKPVPVNSQYLKNGVKSMPIVSLAGPLSNIVFAFLGILATRILVYNMDITKYEYFMIFISLFISINVGLAIFNLLPIPPLDGSNILLPFLPPKAYFWVINNSRYMMIILMILLVTGIGSPFLGFLTTIRGYVIGGLDYLAKLIIGLFMGGGNGYI